MKYKYESGMEDLFFDEVADGLWEARELGIINADLHGDLYCDKGEGMKWLNQ